MKQKNDRFHDRGIELLVLALIKNEIKALESKCKSRKKEAIAWFFGDLIPWQITFSDCCYALNLEISEARKTIMKRFMIKEEEIAKVCKAIERRYRRL